MEPVKIGFLIILFIPGLRAVYDLYYFLNGWGCRFPFKLDSSNWVNPGRANYTNRKALLYFILFLIVVQLILIKLFLI